MKKFISVILAMVMILSVSAFAEGIDISLTELLELPQGNVKEIRMDYKGEGRSITYPEMFDKYFILCNSVKLTKQEDNTWLDNPVDGLFIEVFMEDDTSCYAYISNDGYVDKYSKFMSRLPAKAYKIANFDADNIIKNLLALGEKPQNKFSGWAKEYVLDSEKSGICSFEDYTLPATRLEFCEVLYNAMIFSKALYPTAEYKENKFIDCDNEIVNYFTSLGVISGTGETTFSPDDKIYREEVAAIVYRLAKKLNFKGFLEDYRLSSYLFADTDKMSDWAIEAISQLKTAGIMDGVDSDTFAPKAVFTREQAVALVLKMFSKTKILPTQNEIRVRVQEDVMTDDVVETIKAKYDGQLIFEEMKSDRYLEQTNLIIAAGEPCIIVGKYDDNFLKKLDKSEIKFYHLDNEVVCIENNINNEAIGGADGPTDIFVAEDLNAALEYINPSKLSADFRKFVEKESVALTNEMYTLAKNEKYIQLYTGDGELLNEIKQIASGNYKEPKNITCIEINEDTIGKIIDSSDEEILELGKKNFTGITMGNMINGRNGVNTVAASSMLAYSKGYISPKNFKNTTAVLEFDSDYLSVVSFDEFGDGVIRANCLFVKDASGKIAELMEKMCVTLQNIDLS